MPASFTPRARNSWSASHLLLADRELRERMGRNGKTYVTANYAWDVIMAKYDKLIAALPKA